MLADADRVMRYSLAAAGHISGEPSAVKSTSLRLFINFYHGFICLLLSVNVVVTLSVAWDGQQDAIIYNLFFKLALLFYFMDIAFVNIVLFFNCVQSKKLLSYYKQLEIVHETLKALEITVRVGRIRKAVIFATICGWILSICFGVYQIYDYATLAMLDSIYGESLSSRMNSTTAVLGLQIFGRTCVMICGILWKLTAVLFFTVSFTIVTLFSDFNDKFEKDVAAAPEEAMNSINRYRKAHLKLCDLVEKANSTFSIILGCKIAKTLVVLLLVLYLLTVTSFDEENYQMFFTFIIWLGGEGGTLLLFIGMSELVSRQVSRACIKSGKLSFDQVR